MARFLANRLGMAELGREIAGSSAMRKAGEAVAAAARNAAPDGGPRRGYRESIRVEQDADSVTVGTTDIAGHIIEFGSIKNVPYAPLRRGVRAVGLRLDETPKT